MKRPTTIRIFYAAAIVVILLLLIYSTRAGRREVDGYPHFVSTLSIQRAKQGFNLYYEDICNILRKDRAI